MHYIESTIGLRTSVSSGVDTNTLRQIFNQEILIVLKQKTTIQKSRNFRFPFQYSYYRFKMNSALELCCSLMAVWMHILLLCSSTHRLNIPAQIKKWHCKNNNNFRTYFPLWNSISMSILREWNKLCKYNCVHFGLKNSTIFSWCWVLLHLKYTWNIKSWCFKQQLNSNKRYCFLPV